MAVTPGGKAGADGDHHRGIGHGSSQIAFCQNRVHHPVGVQLPDTGAFRIGQHGDPALLRKSQRFLRGMSQNGFRIFHCAAAAPDCLGKADRSPDGGRLGQVGQDQAIAGAVKPQGDAGGNVPGSPNNDKHSVTPLRIGWRSFPGGCRMGDHASDCPAARQLCSSVWRMLPSKSLPRWSMYSSASYFMPLCSHRTVRPANAAE